MYRIIGDDGREYGPIPAEQLRQWIAEGRANAETMVLTEGSAGWKPLGSFPEFSLLIRPAAPAPLPAAAPLRQTNAFAVMGLAMALLSFCCCCCWYGLPFNLAGVVFSTIGLVQIRSQPDQHSGQGIAIAGLVLALLSILLGLGMYLLSSLGSGGLAEYSPQTRGL